MPAPSYSASFSSPSPSPVSTVQSTRNGATADASAYYNARLDPKNYLEGPLSPNPSTRLRQMLARPGIVVAPGICDGISARAALEAGFDCLYQSGAATTASRLGQPDLAIATLNDFVGAGQMVSSLNPSVPVIADADTGYISYLPNATPCTKRRIRAAVIARDSIPGGSDFVRDTKDSAQVLGMDEAIARLKLASAAGADVCFIEGVRTKELLESTVAALAPTPVLVNVISGGLTPSFTYPEAEQMGAKIIIFSLVSCVAMLHAVRAAMRSLKKTGTDFTSAQGMDPKAFFEVMGLNEVVELDAKAGGSAFQVV